MEWAALLAWVVTALGGASLLAQWLRHGGLRQREGIRALRLFAHAGLAVVGVGLWTAFVVSDNAVLAWVSVGLLVAVVLLGATMLAIWLRGQNRREHTTVPAETSFPVPVVLLHGLLGISTLALAVLAASGVGT
ncbi:MAG: hypothetical protein H0U08_05500 [Actinobacteria bacterium]|nr:hypothetical protein [Actinomycetota bacterium]